MEDKNKTKVLPFVIGVVVGVIVVLAIVKVTHSNSEISQTATTTDTTTTITEEPPLDTTTDAEEILTSSDETTLTSESDTVETTTSTEITTTEITTLITTVPPTDTTTITTTTPTETTTVTTTATTTEIIMTEPPLSISNGTYEGVEPFNRASLTVTTDGDTVYIFVHWADGAMAYSLWTISGTLDPNTNLVEYSDGILEYVEIDPDTYEEYKTVESSTESGTFAFDTGGIIYWTPNDDTLSYYDETSITFLPLPESEY